MIIPKITPNHNVARRINNVAAVAMVGFILAVKISMPAIEASAAPNPPGNAETAPTTVENDNTKIAIPARL